METSSLTVTQPARSDAVRVYVVAPVGQTSGPNVVSSPAAMLVVGDQITSGVYSSTSSSKVIDQPSNVPFPVSALVDTSMDHSPFAVQPSIPESGWLVLNVPVIGSGFAPETAAPPDGTKQAFW